MTRYLVISALGKDRPGIIQQLSKAILDTGCNIADSRMTVLGGEFALIQLISGADQAIAAMEGMLPDLGRKLELTIICKHTEPRPSTQRRAPYAVEVVAMDHPGIVQSVAQFFSSQNINIEEMDTETYAAAHTGTPMFSLSMRISVPAEVRIPQLRESFLDFCDAFNLDATLEPYR